MSEFRLNPHLDIAGLARRYRERGRAHVSDLLAPEGAERLCAVLEQEPRWNLVTLIAGEHRDLDSAAMVRQTPEERKKFLAHVYDPASKGHFQYLYDNVPVYDAWHKGRTDRPVLNAFFQFLNGAEFLGFARLLTGAADIGFADAQATRYGPGHFLTLHDDSIEAKDRRAAYVVNLTRQWSVDWGGLTCFTGLDGHVEEAFAPRFNALNIFRVPQPHAVSVVAPFAARYRYAITGWLRAGKDPGL